MPPGHGGILWASSSHLTLPRSEARRAELAYFVDGTSWDRHGISFWVAWPGAVTDRILLQLPSFSPRSVQLNALR